MEGDFMHGDTVKVVDAYGAGVPIGEIGTVSHLEGDGPEVRAGGDNKEVWVEWRNLQIQPCWIEKRCVKKVG
jgi:hypothetical protein